MTERLAIIGASGFVGSALTEYVLDHTDLSVSPFCHSTGGATRLAHRRLDVRRLDLLDRSAVEAAIHDFDYVVNCSRGGRQLMLDGLENLLRASRKAGVKKFIHLSSVAVYGDPPPPSSTTEDAPTEPAPDSYGAMKLLQDQKVQSAAAAGLNTVILCPPNIVGPYSDYLTDIIGSIELGRFRLIDQGRQPINIVDVNNLSACILSALHADIGDGRRLFVCEPADVTWQQLVMELQPVVRGNHEILSLSADEFSPAAASGASLSPQGKRRRPSAFKHLVSDEVRDALRLHPTWALIEAKAKGGIRLLGNDVEDRLRQTVSGPIKVPVMRQEEALDRTLIAQQLRGIKHDPARCHRELGFRPPLSFSESMGSFRDWYMEYFDAGSPEWALLAESAG